MNAAQKELKTEQLVPVGLIIICRSLKSPEACFDFSLLLYTISFTKPRSTNRYVGHPSYNTETTVLLKGTSAIKKLSNITWSDVPAGAIWGAVTVLIVLVRRLIVATILHRPISIHRVALRAALFSRRCQMSHDGS
jgi:hypothetical protein